MMEDSYFVAEIQKGLTDNGVLSYMRGQIWKEVAAARELPSDAEGLEIFIRKTLQTSSLEVALKNAVYIEKLRLSETTPFILQAIGPLPTDYDQFEPLEYVREAQLHLHDRLNGGIKALHKITGLPLYAERTSAESEQLRKKWQSIGSLKYDHSQLNSLYTHVEILNSIIHITNPNSSVDQAVSTGRLVKLHMNCKSLINLKDQYSQLHPSDFEALSSSSVETIIKTGLYHSALQVCRVGCTNEHRSIIWSMALGIDINLPQHSFHLENLKTQVLRYRILQDDLIIKDIKTVTMNDVEFFVFEDILVQVLLCLLRDQSESFGRRSYHLLPYRKFSILVGPLCYLYQDTEKLYAMFKVMYSRYFSLLHILTSKEKGSIGLCCLFENLMLSRIPELFQYLILIGSHPLKIVFPWFLTGFVGYLSVEQIFILWDFIIGYESLEILAVLAAAIMEFRAKSLFQVSSAGDIEAVLSDLRNITILPLIQQTLFL
ncbi:PREDICTED: TBC1 domain family member 19-like [Amphimedon queenslandica]|uniref:Rab-GAP TBC domain-containing protein n=1 Tax=Amphimedon queenslandica TaxID=400682 RepID=A0A1X7UVC1_AMPQE|nr:PREDICTED: TBC1 domain family member 19-like [Amphimedon queenslandica]|eukprot:XP_011403926.2 PREDICTED: TBC1 domain family member 19-like [Amphimedon queenslandica]